MNLLKTIILLNVVFLGAANASSVVKGTLTGEPIDLPKGAMVLGLIIDTDRVPGQPIDRPKGQVLSKLIGVTKDNGIIDPPRDQILLSKTIDTKKDIIDPPRDQIILSNSVGGTKKDIIDPPRGGLNESMILAAIETIINNELLVSTEAVLVSVGTANSLIPVTVTDYCEIYKSKKGFKYFINELSSDEQLDLVSYCPEMADLVLKVADSVGTSI